MKQRWPVGLMACVFAVGCTLIDSAVQPAPAVVASVNGVRLTQVDLIKRGALMQVATWLSTGGSPTELDEDKIIDHWIDSELLAQASAQARVSASQADAEAEITRLLAESGLGEADLLRQLGVVGLSREEFVQYQQRALIVQRFIETTIWDGVSEAERHSRLATWLARERGAATIVRPTAEPGPRQVAAYAGGIAPGFRLADVNGAEYDLEASRGKAVLLNFWATWCAPCRSEMPILERAFADYRAQGLEIWGINVGESAEQVRRFAAEYQLTFPLLVDADSKVARRYRVYGLPLSVFVARDGVIRDVVVGAIQERSLESLLKRLLN